MASRDIIVIGGSTGAVEALKRICSDLPADLPAAVFVALHTGRHQNDLLAGVLGQRSGLRVTTAKDAEPVEPGRIYVAPADRHLLVMEGVIRLGRGPRENMSRPAVDPLFRSAAVSYGPRVIGVVLTGLLNDGSSGLAAVKQCGGLAVVQNPSDAAADEMPLCALRSCEVDYRASVSELGKLLGQLGREPAGPPVPVPADICLEVQIALGRTIDAPGLSDIAQPAPFTCPSCGGVLSELRSKPPLRFRCQVGHAYTAEALAQEQEGSTDEALRIALRIIDNHATLLERMAADARATNRNNSASMHEERAGELRRHSETIRQALLRSPE